MPDLRKGLLKQEFGPVACVLFHNEQWGEMWYH